MFKGKYTAIELVKNSNFEYIVKDTLGITMGRIFIVEYCEKNKFCSYRIKFYKNSKEYYEYLKDILKTFTSSLFKNMNVNKVNVFVLEDVNNQSFIDLGFRLEGIFTNNNISDGNYKDELIFGIDAIGFQRMEVINILRLKGSNVELKVLTPEDAENLLQYYKRNKQHLRPFEPIRGDDFYTVELQRKSLTEYYKQYLNGTSVNFGIYKDGVLIGKIQLSNIVMGVFKNAFVGYSIDEIHQGKGYMKEALRLAIEYAFNKMCLHRVEAATLIDNIKSQRVLKACGFKEIGLNERYLFINGEWRDHISFCRLNENNN